jgi:hypothetical protein
LQVHDFLPAPYRRAGAAAALCTFAKRIDTKKCGNPVALGVITGNGYGYVRPDGVAVIPIGTLGP